ncbi:hypothetical protein Tco_0699088 [Tanacetum coccineum]
MKFNTSLKYSWLGCEGYRSATSLLVVKAISSKVMRTKEVSKPSGSWVVFAVRVQYFPSNPSPPFTLNTISPLKGVRVFVNCQVGMAYKVGVSGYRVRVSWEEYWGSGLELKTVGEAGMVLAVNGIGPSKSSQSLSIAHKWAVEID